MELFEINRMKWRTATFNLFETTTTNLTTTRSEFMSMKSIVHDLTIKLNGRATNKMFVCQKSLFHTDRIKKIIILLYVDSKNE